MSDDLYFGDRLLVSGDGPADGNAAYEIDGCTYYPNLVQGSKEWFEIRLGIMTASEMKMFFTPKLARSNNEKARAHVYELLGQRISGFIEEGFVGDHMLRGYEDEIKSAMLYSEHYDQVQTCGFCKTERFGFPLGYSPDGLVGAHGLIEAKSRVPKYQVQTILDHIAPEDPESPIPLDFMIQMQTGLLVTGRKWIDFLSYCGGLPMIRVRVYPDPELQESIIEVGKVIEATIQKNIDLYEVAIKDNPNAIPTKRTVEQEMVV